MCHRGIIDPEHEIVLIHTKIFGFVLPASGHVKIVLNARRAAVARARS